MAHGVAVAMHDRRDKIHDVKYQRIWRVHLLKGGRVAIFLCRLNFSNQLLTSRCVHMYVCTHDTHVHMCTRVEGTTERISGGRRYKARNGTRGYAKREREREACTQFCAHERALRQKTRKGRNKSTMKRRRLAYIGRPCKLRVGEEEFLPSILRLSRAPFLSLFLLLPPPPPPSLSLSLGLQLRPIFTWLIRAEITFPYQIIVVNFSRQMLSHTRTRVRHIRLAIGLLCSP